MSGGSQNYIHTKIQDLSNELFNNDGELVDSEIQQVRDVYKSVALMLRSVEFVESGDLSTSQLKSILNDFKKEINKLIKE